MKAFAIWRDVIGIPEPHFSASARDCTVGCDCDRYVEVWNIVFSQFNNDGHGNYTELKQKNIDTGMGLERLACVCQNVASLFDVDTVMNITNKVSRSPVRTMKSPIRLTCRSASSPTISALRPS